MKHIKLLVLAVLLTWVNALSFAQDTKKPDWKKLHYLSEEEMLSGEKATLFNETTPPSGDYVRFPAEFEPMQAVTIRYPLGIPTSLVKQLSERTKVYCIVSSSYESQARSTFQSAGCNMSNITYYNMSTDSYWVRDYAPWYIFNDLEPAIVDNVYNRPRYNDNLVPVNMGQQLGLTVYGMNLTHTGGNMMEDGRGVGVSDELVLNENGNSETNVRQKMKQYLGIDPYHITIDPQGDYIAHVDCWGKLLAPDKILIAQLPTSNSQYDEYEQVAEFFANTNCCWGYPYKVFRVYEPGGSTLAPYTNSLIINNTVFVPMGSNSTYNNRALQVYQEALPGYEIIGVTGASSTPWQNTDALHCRTRGVMDFDMLFVDHRDVVYGEQPKLDSIAITSKFIAYSGQALKQDSLLVYYRIDDGEYQTAKMRPTGTPNEYVGYIKGYHYGSSVDYYVFGADQSGHRYSQPSFGAVEPHHFSIEAGNNSTAEQVSEFTSGWNWWTPSIGMDGVELLTQLEQGLGNKGIKILAQGGSSRTYSSHGWSGTLSSLEVGSMYMIQVNSNCSVTFEGSAIDVANQSITLNPGNNWIGFFGAQTMSVNAALANLNASNGDVITAQDGKFTTYSSHGWGGSLQELVPGEAYIYNSKDNDSKSFTFPSNNKKRNLK